MYLSIYHLALLRALFYCFVVLVQFHFIFTRIVSLALWSTCMRTVRWSHLEIGVAAEWFQIGYTLFYYFNVCFILLFSFVPYKKSVYSFVASSFFLFNPSVLLWIEKTEWDDDDEEKKTVRLSMCFVREWASERASVRACVYKCTCMCICLFESEQVSFFPLRYVQWYM